MTRLRLSIGMVNRLALVVPAHEMDLTAFPAIDVHNLVKDARGEDREVPVDELLARMDRLNLKRLAA